MLTRFAALGGFASVALGAFGAHGIEPYLSREAFDWWETGTLYLIVHSGVALAISLAPLAALQRRAGWIMMVSALWFAGTLYALALGAPRIMGALTPIGGVGLLVGWGLLVLSGARLATTSSEPQNGDA